MIFAVNDAYTISPRADVVYAADEDWWRLHFDRLRDHRAKNSFLTSPLGGLWTCNNQFIGMLNYVEGTSSLKFASEKQIAYGGNSGFQAVNLAYWMGFEKVILLGYDMGYAAGTPKHFFGEHPPRIHRTSNYPAWLKSWKAAAPVMKSLDFKVINASRKTALTCFPQMDIMKALKEFKP